MGVCTSKTSTASPSRDTHPTGVEVAAGNLDPLSMSNKNRQSSNSSDSESNHDTMKNNGDSHNNNRGEEARGRVIDDKDTTVPPPPPKSQPSKLEDSQRRRLSVSTVQVHEDVPTTPTQPQKKASEQLKDGSLTPPADSSKNVDTISAESTTADLQPASDVRSKIKKFPDPALELLNEKTGSIREVTIDMIMDLVSNSDLTYMVFGMPSEEIQRGFDNKKMSIVGTLVSHWDPYANGVGFACKKGLKPESPNQDDFFIIKVDDWCLYGVFDGHGPYGHDVSSFIHRALPFLILADANFETDPTLVMRRAFRKAHHLLEALSESSDHTMDCTLSGTTGTVVLHRDNKLYCAHVGDSRSVLASKSNERIKATDLTQDHKPTREDEKRRIDASGGEVRRLEGDIPHRVFVKNRMYPGLAMSRAIGDTVGAAVGVVPDPDVKIVELSTTGADQFVIVSTDGVWEFISSQEAVDFVCQKKKSEVQKAAEFVAYESWRRWVEEEENVVDDVTCVIFYVDGPQQSPKLPPSSSR